VGEKVENTSKDSLLVAKERCLEFGSLADERAQ
jgi:hypothetical protein